MDYAPDICESDFIESRMRMRGLRESLKDQLKNETHNYPGSLECGN